MTPNRSFALAAVFLIALTLTPSLLAGVDYQIQAGHSGSWFDPAQSGHGVTVEILTDGRVLIWWFTFDADGNRVWVGGTGVIDGDRVVIEAIVVDGGVFPPEFDPNDITVVTWGSITIIFVDCENALMSWVPVLAGYAEGEMPLVRLTRLLGLEDQCEPPEMVAADFTIPLTSAQVGTDFTLSPGEWDDAATTQIVIANNWTVTVHMQTDGQNIAFAFENLGGPGGINRPTGQAQPNTLFPELFFDLNPDGREVHTDDNYWFHASFQDCSFQRFFNLVVNCDFIQAGWLANNWPLTDSNIIEIVVTYELLGLEPNVPHLIGLTVPMTSALVGNPVYHHWADGVDEANPSTWPSVMIEGP